MRYIRPQIQFNIGREPYLMTQSRMARPAGIASHVRLRAATIATLASLVLGACGGNDGPADPAVTSALVAATRYGATALVTVMGSNLDDRLVVSSTGCKDMTRLTAAPHASTAATAYYQCTVSGGLASTVHASFGGKTLGSADFSVPAPVVTMTVSNGADIQGDLVITLAPDDAPNTVDNFLGYVNTGFYNGTIMHGMLRTSGRSLAMGGFFGPGGTNESNAPQPAQPHDPIPLEAIRHRTDDVTYAVGAFPHNIGNTIDSMFFITRYNDDTLLDFIFGQLSPDSIALVEKMNTDCPGLDGDACFLVPNVAITSATQTQ
jgi:cyclophilin family peptidyl-prolyl cis-trans isomerase